VLRLAFEAIAREGLRAGQILRGIRNVVQRETAVSDGVDVNALAAEAVRLLEPQARMHGVTVRLLGASPLPAVQADGTQIEQVMLNLMLNGVEAAASTAGDAREVVVATRAHEGAVEVAVSDTGKGIPPKVEQRLFTPFFTTKTQGLGLGLAISRSIVECHGGLPGRSPGQAPGRRSGSSCRWSRALPPGRRRPDRRAARRGPRRATPSRRESIAPEQEPTAPSQRGPPSASA
jgi:C4-dicarboxylate-specific signal transduction histidine kinase